MIRRAIIIHEISQELQASVLMEKWFPNFFHTLVNHQLNKHYKSRNNDIFPYCNLNIEVIRSLFVTIDYTSEYYDQDIQYILNIINTYPKRISAILKDKKLDDFLCEKVINCNDYYYFDLDNDLKINELRLSMDYVNNIKARYPKNTLEDIIGLILRFSLTSNYSWCSRSITNATTLMVPRLLHNYVKSLSSDYLECYSSVINANTERYCSIFDDDLQFAGCMGSFCIDTLNSIKPKLLFANPPYDNGTVSHMVNILINYHKHHKALSIITVNRKDGGLYDMINDKYDNEIYEGLITLLSHTNSKLLDILVVPNYLMSYELIDNDDIKILGIKRDTSFIIYGDNILDISIHELKSKLLQLICEFRLVHTKKKKKIKYNNRASKMSNVDSIIDKYHLSHKFNYKRSITDNYKLLTKIFN